MQYKVRAGESPRMIAQKFRVSMPALIGANPHKPTHVVAGQTTWQGVLADEPVNIPVGVGDALTDAIMAMGSPCDQANVGLVCQVQRLLGVTVDGKYGSGTAAAARAVFPSAPPGCSPRPSWWAPSGKSNCSATASAPLPSGPTANATTAAVAALAALQADPNYCSSVKRAGTPVNTAIHNFKAAWNTANPTNPVPINTGNYEPIVQIAIALALNVTQDNIPPGCGAAPVIAPPAPVPAPVPGPTNVVIAPSSAPAAVQALLGINPCDPSSVTIVCAAQRALGVTVDGKYGSGTATAAARVLPGAPPACSPRPSWWAPSGKSNCPGAAPSPMPSPAPTPPGPPPPPPPPVPTPSSAASAVQMLITNSPCLQANVELVRAAQRALGGLTVDGKYGTNTANAARRVVSNAPAACVPAPAWWGAKGVPAPPPPPGPMPGPAPGPSQPVVVVPEKKGISTGAIIAGAVGAAALVGLIAVAATGKKGHRGARGRRGPSGHKKRKKSSHRRARRH